MWLCWNLCVCAGGCDCVNPVLQRCKDVYNVWIVCVCVLVCPWTWQCTDVLRELLQSLCCVSVHTYVCASMSILGRLCDFVHVCELGIITALWQRSHVVLFCVRAAVRALGIMILPELPCCLLLCSDPVPWCTAAIQGSVLIDGQLGIIGTKQVNLIGYASSVNAMQLAEQDFFGKFDAVSASEWERVVGVWERKDEWMRKGEISLGGLYQLWSPH